MKNKKIKKYINVITISMCKHNIYREKLHLGDL